MNEKRQNELLENCTRMGAYLGEPLAGMAGRHGGVALGTPDRVLAEQGRGARA